MIRALAAAGLAVLLVMSSCTTETALRQDDDRVQVIVTTPILKDLVEQVGGDHVLVSSIVPETADPHSHEPTLRSIRNIVYADLAFSNYLMLEQHSIIKALDANLRHGVLNVSLAEGAIKHAAEVIPLVENVATESVWLGMRVRGDGDRFGATRSSEVEIATKRFEGPGEGAAYLTQSFGEPLFYMDSSSIGSGGFPHVNNVATLPTDAHTHMGWVFSEPGYYQVELIGSLAVSSESEHITIADATVTFAVGVDPNDAPNMNVENVLDHGHADIAVDLDTEEIYLYADHGGGGDATQRIFDPESTVIALPASTAVDLPSDAAFRFLGKPGEQVYQLPQAVLGKHVHGDVDPHLWHDVANAIAYVHLIAESLIDVDPANAAEYQDARDRYIAELNALDIHMHEMIQSIPQERRKLITTHDAFGYLAAAYGIEIAGFVTPNPAAEPSLADRHRLTTTIEQFDIPAVFLEPNLIARSSTLTEVAEQLDVQVCRIYADSFGPDVGSYQELMEFNAASLQRCLTA